MCGIFYVNGGTLTLKELKTAMNKIKHRGPDNTKSVPSLKRYDSETYKNLQLFPFFGFHRLAIHGLNENGDQPLSKHNSVLICNGEIYNYKSLATMFTSEDYSDKSDCEIILDLYTQLPNTFCNLLDGVYSFVLHNFNTDTVFAARDPIGVRPLFYGYIQESICFASEAKALVDICEFVKEFPPGHYYNNKKFVCYAEPKVSYERAINHCSYETLKHLLISAVEKRLDSERPVGFFLSGGLDSSLVCSISSRLLQKQIHTFSIGISEHSPDIINARKVASHIGSKHTEIYFSTEEALNCLENVIYQLESYDCTTIRASVPMYIMSKYVSENTDFKVILSGEGADELFGGYLYFHNAPSVQEFHNETQHLLANVHKYDVLRADRCTAGHGLELRVPFFDKTLRNYVNNMNPNFKLPKDNMEKKVLRDAFANDDYLPYTVLYRQKNGMSDAVGYNWVDFIRNYANSVFSDEEFRIQTEKYDSNPPVSKEELYYRQIYDKYYKKIDFLPHIWRPKYTTILDPSAAMLEVFNDTTQQHEQSVS